MSTQNEGPAAMSPLWFRHTVSPSDIPPIGPTDLIIRVPLGARRHPCVADVNDDDHARLRRLIGAFPKER